MKILSVAWIIQDNNIPELTNVLTGAGILIHNICEFVGRKDNSSYVMVGAKTIKSFTSGNIQYIDNNLELWDGKDNDQRLKLLEEGFVRNLELIKPDVVNFHGTGDFICNCIKICTKRKIKCVVTIHLYIEKKLNIANVESAKKYLFDVISINDVRLITVGTGMKNKIHSDFCNVKEENITVIPNGTDYIATKVDTMLRRKYGFEHKKILLLAGTICERKNQIQVIEAFKLIPKELKNRIAVVFCGKDAMNGQLQNAILLSDCENGIVYVGAIPQSEMKEYYSIADGYIMPSLAEGLSISCLEAMRYGIPQIMFADSECADDLNDEKVVCFANERTNECLARTIEEWYYKEWDTEYIKNFSKYFSMERVAEDYINYYKQLLK